MNAKKHNLVDLPLHEISKKQCIQTNDKNELYFSLSEMRRVTLSLFKGQQYVNVREYYRNENDESLVPGRKGNVHDEYIIGYCIEKGKFGKCKKLNVGMALTMEQWDQLFLMHKEIDEIVHCIEMEEMVTEFTNVQKRENGEYEAKVKNIHKSLF